MTRLLVVEPGYCPYQAGFPSAIAAASEVIEGESQILKPFGTPRIGLICSKAQSRLKYNRQVNDEGVTVRGRFLVCGLNGDKVIGLSKDQADRYSRLLFLPQVEDIENKQKFIGQIMTSKSPARSCDDMDEAALSYAEVKALAAGNPLIKEKMDLDVQLTRLKTLKAAHDSQRYELENKIAIGFPAEIRKCKEQIENATVDAVTVKEHSVVDADGKDVFCIQLEKKVYYEKEPAGKALLGLLGLALNSEKPVPIGYFKGMELQIQHLPFGNEYHARLAGSGTYSTQLGADVLGNLTRLSNLANGIEPSIEKTRNMQIQLEQQLASAEEEVKRPFPQATELTEKSKRLAVLEGLLNMNDKDIVTDTEPEQQCQIDNRQRGQEER